MPESSALHSPASSRSSISADRNSLPTQRRNRNALRDYYKIADTTSENPVPATEELIVEPEEVSASQFDTNNFDAERFVMDLLNRGTMHDLLRLESGLASDIRTLDGERKALVYDNYSKLIAATDTIERMRSSMDPLAPTTETLKPAITKIEQMSEQLSDNLRVAPPEVIASKLGDGEIQPRDGAKCNLSQRHLVRWTLESPNMLQSLLRQGKQEEAKQMWKEIETLLDTWNNVSGVDEVRYAVRAIMSVVT